MSKRNKRSDGPADVRSAAPSRPYLNEIDQLFDAQRRGLPLDVSDPDSLYMRALHHIMSKRETGAELSGYDAAKETVDLFARLIDGLLRALNPTLRAQILTDLPHVTYVPMGSETVQ